MIVGNVRPTNRRQWVEQSKLNSSLKPWWQLFQNSDFIPQGRNEMINIKYVFKLTVTWIENLSKSEEVSIQNLWYSTWYMFTATYIRLMGQSQKGNWTHLGSLQNEVLSSSGTIRVTFRYLAIATMSQICTAVVTSTKHDIESNGWSKNSWQY